MFISFLNRSAIISGGIHINSFSELVFYVGKTSCFPYVNSLTVYLIEIERDVLVLTDIIFLLDFFKTLKMVSNQDTATFS